MKRIQAALNFCIALPLFLLMAPHGALAQNAGTDALPAVIELLQSQPTKLGRSLQEKQHPQDIDDFNAMSWNMQGATGNGENKWIQVANMMRDENLDIAALQEAGSPPQSAMQYYNYGVRLETTFNRGTSQQLTYQVNHYGWLPHGSNGNFYHIFHLPIDSTNQGLRTNIAIVTRFDPTRIVLVPPATQQNGSRGPRPALGIEIRNSDAGRPGTATTFYTFHASSNGDNISNDATNMLVSINRWHRLHETPTYPGGDTLATALTGAAPTRSYAVLGDFNRNLLNNRYDPYERAHCPMEGIDDQCVAEDHDNLCRAAMLDPTMPDPNVLGRVALLRTGRETQSSGGELDFGVAANFGYRNPWFMRAVATILTAAAYTYSDHRPILFKHDCKK
jgi:hypothetical protein